MIKRLFDILSSLVGLVILCPILFIISLVVVSTSRGGVFYTQIRVGKNSKEFKLLKFRTMKPYSDNSWKFTIVYIDS
ncbi:MAG: sugar transferase [Flavobacteriales bacterium]